jgi:hypothetical protein
MTPLSRMVDPRRRTSSSLLPSISAASEGVRGYALDPEAVEVLWKKSEELVGESF